MFEAWEYSWLRLQAGGVIWLGGRASGTLVGYAMSCASL